MKRPAAAIGTPAGKRGCVPAVVSGPAEIIAAEIAEQCDSIVEVLKSHEATPADDRALLCHSVYHSLTICKDDRHRFQHTCVDEIGKILESVKLAMEEEVANSQSAVHNVASKDARATTVQQAMDELQKLRYQSADIPDQAISDVRKCQELESVLAAAKGRQDGIDIEYAKLEFERASLDAALSEQFYPLGVITGTRKEIEGLLGIGRLYGFDESLLYSARNVLKMQPESRGCFGEKVLSEVEAAFKSKIKEMDDQLVDLKQVKVERAAIVDAARAECQKAGEKAAASTESLDKAFYSQKDKEKDVAEKRKAVSRYFPELKKAADRLDAANAALSTFMSGPMKAFSDLKELAPAPLHVPLLKPTEADEFSSSESIRDLL